MHLVRLATTLLKDEGSPRDNRLLACNFAKFVFTDFNFFTNRLNNIPFLILLFLYFIIKYVATLPIYR